MSSQIDVTEQIKLQNEEWDQVRKHLESVINNLSSQSLLNSYKQLYQVNILWANNVLVNALLRGDYDPTYVAAITEIINIDIPEFGELISKEACLRFIYYFSKKDYYQTNKYIVILAQLFNYDVIHEIIILQLLQLLTNEIDKPNGQNNLFEVSTDLVIVLFHNCGKKLLELSKKMHNVMFDKLRTLLQTNRNLTRKLRSQLERLFEVRQKNYKDSKEQNLIPLPFEINDNEGTPHVFMIDDEFLSEKPNLHLDTFKYKEDLDKIDIQFKDLRFNILDRLNTGDDKHEVVTIHDMTNNDSIEFKKKIYLTLKSSLTGDEAAHKLLKQRIPDGRKSEVVDILVKSMLQESSYSKFYGIISEKLCGSHWSWKPAFMSNFKESIKLIEDMEPNHLRNCGKFWGHMISTDFVGFELLEDIELTEEGSSPPLRILIKFLFQECVFELGLDLLKERLNEPYIQTFLKGVFPQENIDDIRYSINYFTAIGLGVLTEGMRQQLNIIEEAEREEEEQQQEEGEEEEDESEEQEETEQIEVKEEEIEIKPESTLERVSRYEPNQRKRNRSVTPPRRRVRRERSVTPPRRNRR